MASWLIDYIPVTELDIYAWRVGLFAILLSMTGGLCGWIALDIRNRISENKISSESAKAARLTMAENELAEAKAKITEMEERRRPRTLTEAQKTEMLNRLKPKAGSKLLIATVMGDSEATQYAWQIRTVFLDAGWKVEDVRPMLPTKKIPIGLFIMVRNPDPRNIPEEAHFINRIFLDMGFKIEGGNSKEVPEGMVRLDVCSKP